MDALTSLIPLPLLALCFGITLLAGTVKGMVGFAMPMVMISLMSSVIDPELALAGLILPTVITNATQALRQGWRAALEAMLRFRVFLGVGLVALVISSQLVRVLPQETLLLMIGLPVSVFSALQLMGWQLRLPERGRLWIESAVTELLDDHSPAHPFLGLCFYPRSLQLCHCRTFKKRLQNLDKQRPDLEFLLCWHPRCRYTYGRSLGL